MTAFSRATVRVHAALVRGNSVRPRKRSNRSRETWMSNWAYFITVRVFNGDVYSDPCAFIPQAGIVAFWHALGVAEDAEEKLQPEWVKGNLVPVAPAFPVLSWLIQMQVDHSTIRLADVPELLREIAIGRQNCKETLGIAVFDELEKAAKLALAQGKDISLSPFG
jgi:hypothetical protein